MTTTSIHRATAVLPSWTRGVIEGASISGLALGLCAGLVASPSEWLARPDLGGARLLETADLVATAVFALTAVWGLIGRTSGQRRLSRLVFGIAIALCTANGGGTTRDLLGFLAGAQEHLIPFWVRDPRVLVVTLVGGAVGWWLARRGSMEGRWADGAELADAWGLGLFAVMGAGKVVPWVADLGAWGPVIAIAAGTLSAAGGGILRDVLIVDRPAFALRSCYGLAAAMGASVHVMGMAMGGASGLTALLGGLVTFGVAWRFRDVAWEVPADRRVRARLGRGLGRGLGLVTRRLRSDLDDGPGQGLVVAHAG